MIYDVPATLKITNLNINCLDLILAYTDDRMTPILKSKRLSGVFYRSIERKGNLGEYISSDYVEVAPLSPRFYPMRQYHLRRLPYQFQFYVTYLRNSYILIQSDGTLLVINYRKEYRDWEMKEKYYWQLFEQLKDVTYRIIPIILEKEWALFLKPQ